MSQKIKKISIIGLGMMGSSLARAILKYLPEIEVHGYDIEADPKICGLKFCDNFSDLVKDTDLVIFSSPLGFYRENLARILPHLKKGTILSDIGSTKSFIFKEILPILPQDLRANFIPAHPIAGSQNSGAEFGKADLFMDNNLIICADEQSSKDATKLLANFWQDLGAKIQYLDAEEHDKIFALTSHLPHFLAFELCDALKNTGRDPFEGIFKESLRIGASNRILWADIFAHNQHYFGFWLEKYRENFKINQQAIMQGDFSCLEVAWQKYDKLTNGKTSQSQTSKDQFLFRALLTSATLLNMLDDEYENYVGAGFLDFVSIIQSRLRFEVK